MKLAWPFLRRKAAPTPSDAARALSGLARSVRDADHQTYRKRVRAKAREMRARMGLPPAPELEER